MWLLAFLVDCRYGLEGARKHRGHMRGIEFVTNERGHKTAVLIDLKRHGELWEDFYDSVIARNRAVSRESPWMPSRRAYAAGKLRG